MEQNIEITRGDTASFNLQFVDFAGDLEHDVQDMFLTVKEDINGLVLFQKSLGNGISKVIDNVYVVRIAPEDTEDLNLGFYYYDFEVKINDDVFTLLKGVMQIAYDVTDSTSVVTIAPYAELQDIRVGYDGNVYSSAGDAVRDQVSDLHEEVNVLDSRMDEFASLPDGSTTGDAELQDIRVGANGVIYPSAGNAVREQVEELDDKIDDNVDLINSIDTDVDVLKSRMDIFASLPDGSTAGDAELLDIRVGANGVTYPSAGQAVRVQVNEIDSDINNIADKVVGINLANPNNAIVGAVQSDGSIATNGVWGNQLAGEFILVEPNTDYYYTDYDLQSHTPTTGRKNYVFFDASRNAISESYNSISTRGASITSPANAKYVRLSWQNTTLPMFAKSNTSIGYIPFQETYINKMFLNRNDNYCTVDELVDTLLAKKVLQSKNLMNPATLQVGKFLAYDDTFADLEAYSTTDYIPITAGQSITCSPYIRSAMLYDTSKAYISNSYYNQDTLQPSTFTATVDGFLRASIYTNKINDTQIEYGNTATSYEAYYRKYMPEDDIELSVAMKNEVEQLISAGGSSDLYVSSSNNILSISEENNQHTLRRTYAISGGGNKLLNFNFTYLDDALIKESTDDITPLRLKVYFSGVEGTWTIGANHGWMCFRCSKGSLTQDDLGSIWSDGSNQYVLIVVDNTYAYFSYPCTSLNGYPNVILTDPIGALSHVSGATHTGNVDISGGIRSQLYPSVNHHTIKIYTGDTELPDDGVLYTNKVRIVEHYEIMDYLDIINTIKDNIGDTLESLADTITSILSVDLVYEITKSNEIIYTTLTALSDCKLKNCGFIQASKSLAVGGTLYRYVDGVKNGSIFASSELHDMTNYSTDNNIYKSDLIDENKPSDRAVDLCISSNNILYGFTMGYIIDKGYGSYAERSALNNVIWDMRGSGKLYPFCIVDKVLNEGESVNVIGYRHYIMPDQEITNKTIIECGKDKYIMLDAHSAISGACELPMNNIGDDVAVNNASGFDVSDVVASKGITYSNSASYGYAVLKVK